MMDSTDDPTYHDSVAAHWENAPEKVKYRVWPDGTVQEAVETPYPWMSDDCREVWAKDAETAELDVNWT